MSKVSVFLPSFNKPEYVIDAIDSVLSQTHQDLELWILENSNDGVTRDVIKESPWMADTRVRYVEIDFTDGQRNTAYVTSVLCNEYFDRANGKYIFYISDDDVIDPRCFELMVREDKDVVFHTQKVVKGSGSEWGLVSVRAADREIGFGTGIVPDCYIDGGQILFKKECLKHIERPYFETDMFHAHHMDGLFMNKLAEKYVFYPVNYELSTHRITEKSLWTR